MMTEREHANRDVRCGDPAYPLEHGRTGCGARDWRAFWNPLPDKAGGERLLVCQGCGAECLVQFPVANRNDLR